MSGLFSLGHNGDEVMHSEFMGFALDEDSLDALRNWAEQHGYPSAVVQQGGMDMFAQLLGNSAPPKMVIVDIDGQKDPVSTISRVIALCGGECRLVALGSKNDVTLYRGILGAGAIDYLVKPLLKETLNQALSTAQRKPAMSQNPEAKEARIVVLTGARGGVGTSTIALNMGWILAHECDQNTGLLDLDLHFGTSALSLDLDPGHGLHDIVSSPNRVDALMIASSIVPESDRFSILSAEEPIDEATPIDSSAITALLKEMNANFDVIVIDLPRFLFPSQKRLLSSAHEIVIVSDLSLPGIRDTLRMKSALNTLGCTGRISTVASRTDAAGAGQITQAVYEKGIKGSVDALIPEDFSSIATAANSGKPLCAVAPHASVTKALRSLAVRLANLEEQRERKNSSFWNKLAGDVKSKVERKGKP